MNYAMAGFLCAMFAVPLVIWTRLRQLGATPKDNQVDVNEGEEDEKSAETKM